MGDRVVLFCPKCHVRVRVQVSTYNFESLPMNINFRNIPLRLTLRDDAAGGTPLELPRQNLAAPATVVGLMFLIFAGVFVYQIARLNLHPQGDIFGIVSLLFDLFWLLGWSAGVLLLGALTILLFFGKDAARVVGKQVRYIVSIGPVNIIREYDLGLIRNLRVEAEPDGQSVRLRFDYKDQASTLGNIMPQNIAERNLAVLNREMDKLVF